MEKVENPSQEMKDLWHKDSANWYLGMFYYNKKDPRIFVRKRSPWMGTGVSPNLARLGGVFWAALIIGFIFLVIKYKVGY